MAAVLAESHELREQWKKLKMFPLPGDRDLYRTHGSFVFPGPPIMVRVHWKNENDPEEQLKAEALRVLVCQCLAVRPADRPNLEQLSEACQYFDQVQRDPDAGNLARILQDYLLGDDSIEPNGKRQ